jgi:hypothetical protein
MYSDVWSFFNDSRKSLLRSYSLTSITWLWVYFFPSKPQHGGCVLRQVLLLQGQAARLQAPEQLPLQAPEQLPFADA